MKRVVCLVESDARDLIKGQIYSVLTQKEFWVEIYDEDEDRVPLYNNEFEWVEDVPLEKNNLQELIEQADLDMSIYKNADTEEVEKRLDEILKAGKLEQIGNDTLTSLEILNDNLYISTSYRVRGCDGFNHITLPMFVINDPDPITAAKVWARNNKIATAKYEIEQAERVLERRKKDLIDAENEVW